MNVSLVDLKRQNIVNWMVNCIRRCTKERASMKRWHYESRLLDTALLATLAQDGLERLINGTGVIPLMPENRFIGENYEPDVWKHLMNQVRLGDVVVDVAANMGLYAIAIASGYDTPASYTRSSSSHEFPGSG